MKGKSIFDIFSCFVALLFICGNAQASDRDPSNGVKYRTQVTGEGLSYIYHDLSSLTQNGNGTLSLMEYGTTVWKIPVNRYCSNGIVFCQLEIPTLVDGEASDPIVLELNWVKSENNSAYLAVSNLKEKIGYFTFYLHPFSQTTLGTTAKHVPVEFDNYSSLANLFEIPGNVGSIDAVDECLSEIPYQAGISVCLERVLEETSGELVVVLREARNSAKNFDGLVSHGESLSRLEASEKAWEYYRTAHCSLIEETWRGGSGAFITRNSCLIRLTNMRILELRGMGF